MTLFNWIAFVNNGWVECDRHTCELGVNLQG